MDAALQYLKWRVSLMLICLSSLDSDINHNKGPFHYPREDPIFVRHNHYE